MKKVINLLLQYLIPHHALSRLVAKIANCRIPLIKNFVIKQFCKFYHIDMTDAVDSNILSYQTFNDFFTRPLKPTARPIVGNDKVIISPVDGRIYQFGKVDSGMIINAKGKGYTLEQLLTDVELAKYFGNANFAVLYLAPSDYHRVHMPITGKLKSMLYVPGKLYTVNPSIVNSIPDVFAKNERIIITFDTAFGVMAMVLVGAMIVGSIETKWGGVIVPNKWNDITSWNYNDLEMVFTRGLEIGQFKLGSTVILLFPEQVMQWGQELHDGIAIKMGQSLGALF